MLPRLRFSIVPDCGGLCYEIISYLKRWGELKANNIIFLNISFQHELVSTIE